MRLPLIKIVLDSLCLAEQGRHLLFRGFSEFVERMEHTVEFLCELGVFLVPPCLAEAYELAVNTDKLCLQITAESLQLSSETAQFIWVNDGLGQNYTSLQETNVYT